MTNIFHPAPERGHVDFGWLDSHHSFSFGNWHDREKVHFGALRVLNDDVVKGGNGLECDKLSGDAMDVHFANMMGKLIAHAGSMAGPTLSATHIDSWEVGSQNWTPKFREEFQKP